MALHRFPLVILFVSLAACARGRTSIQDPAVPVKKDPGKVEERVGPNDKSVAQGAEINGTINVKQLMPYIDANGVVPYKFSFLLKLEEKTMQLKDGLGKLELTGLEADKEGTLTLEIKDGDRWRFKATKVVKLKVGANDAIRLEMVDTDAATNADLKIDVVIVSALTDFERDVQPYVKRECVGCHVSKGKGPQGIDQEAAFKAKAEAIYFALYTNKMPEGKAKPAGTDEIIQYARKLYFEDKIKPLTTEYCAPCHANGGAAPLLPNALTSFDEYKTKAGGRLRSTDAKKSMPKSGSNEELKMSNAEKLQLIRFTQ